MSRKKTQPKKNIVPDPKFNSTIIPKLINNIMYDGKRGVAAKIVYDAISWMHKSVCTNTYIINVVKELQTFFSIFIKVPILIVRFHLIFGIISCSFFFFF